MIFNKNKPFTYVSILFVVNILCMNLFTYAQTPENAYSYFNISASVISNTNNNLIHRFWDPKKGFELMAETPFYWGNIQAGVISIHYNGKNSIYPDFKERLLFLGLGKEITLPLKFKLYSGIKIGYFVMNFIDDTLSLYQQTESEFSTGVNFRLSYPVITNLSLTVASDFTLLFTHEKLKFYYLSAGIAYKFTSPQWLKDFFN